MQLITTNNALRVWSSDSSNNFSLFHDTIHMLYLSLL